MPGDVTEITGPNSGSVTDADALCRAALPVVFPYRATFALVALYYLIAHGRFHMVLPVLATFPCAMIAGILVVLAFCFEYLGRGNSYRPIREEKLVLGLLLLCLITLPTSIWPSNSLNVLMRNFFPTVVTMLVTGVICERLEDIRRFLWLYMINCSLIIYVAHGEELNHYSKKVSDTYDVNDIAMILSCSLPVVYQFILQLRGLKRLVAWAFFVSAAVTIVYTESRGGLLGLFTFTAYLVFSSRHKARYFLLACAALSALLIMAPDSARERYATMINPESEYDRKLGDRTQVWEKGLLKVLDSPLLGVGLGNYVEADGRGREAGDAWRTAHNSFLQVSLELGILGFVLFFALVLGTYRKLRALRRRLDASAEPPQVLWLIKGIEGSLLVYLATALFLSQAYNRQFYFLIALLVAAQKILLNDRRYVGLMEKST